MRANAWQKEPTDINVFCDEYLRLGYHGMRAKDKSFNATIQTDLYKLSYYHNFEPPSFDIGTLKGINLNVQHICSCGEFI